MAKIVFWVRDHGLTLLKKVPENWEKMTKIVFWACNCWTNFAQERTWKMRKRTKIMYQSTNTLKTQFSSFFFIVQTLYWPNWIQRLSNVFRNCRLSKKVIPYLISLYHVGKCDNTPYTNFFTWNAIDKKGYYFFQSGVVSPKKTQASQLYKVEA